MMIPLSRSSRGVAAGLFVCAFMLLPFSSSAQAPSHKSAVKPLSTPKPIPITDAKELFREAFDAYQKRQWDDAEQLFGAGLKLSPNDYQARYYYGLSLYSLHRIQDAKAQLEYVIANAPNDPLAEKARVAIDELDGRAPGVHVVKSGETLYGIAARYGRDFRDIADYNQISDSSRLPRSVRIPPINWRGPSSSQ